MAKKVLARDQKKGKEIIPSVLVCLVCDDFRGSHSPVFCGIIAFSIFTALASGEFEVLHKISSTALTWVPERVWEARAAFGLFSSRDHSLGRDLSQALCKRGREAKPKTLSVYK